MDELKAAEGQQPESEPESAPEAAGPRCDVSHDEHLRRRIHPTQMVGTRPSSAAFKDYNLSVDCASIRSARESLEGHDGHGLAEVTARACVTEEQEVVLDPAPQFDNPAHALVVGKKGGARSRRFAKEHATMLVFPGDPPPEEDERREEDVDVPDDDGSDD